MRKKTDREYRRDRSTAARPPRRRPAATRHSGTKTMTFLSDIEGATRTLALIEKMPHADGMRLSSKEDRPVRSSPAMCSPRSASHRSKRMAISSGRRFQWKPPTRLRRLRRKARRRRDSSRARCEDAVALVHTLVSRGDIAAACEELPCYFKERRRGGLPFWIPSAVK